MEPGYRSAEYLPGSFHMDPRRSDAFYLAAGGGAGVQFCVYEHTQSIVLGSPSVGVVNVYDKDDESTVIDTDIPWVGNLTMFDDQIIGDRGTCLLIAGKAYAVNAPCSGTGTPSSSTGLYIGTTAPTNTSLLWIDTSGL